MLLAPILLAGNSAVVQTNAVANTNNNVPVLVALSGANSGLNIPGVAPLQIRLLNTGTALIWLSFASPVAVAAVIPTTGTTTLGTPTPVVWVAPNIETSLTLPCGIQGLTGVPGRNDTPLGFWLSTISTGVSQTLLLQLGDGT